MKNYLLTLLSLCFMSLATAQNATLKYQVESTNHGMEIHYYHTKKNKQKVIRVPGNQWDKTMEMSQGEDYSISVKTGEGVAELFVYVYIDDELVHKEEVKGEDIEVTLGRNSGEKYQYFIDNPSQVMVQNDKGEFIPATRKDDLRFRLQSKTGFGEKDFSRLKKPFSGGCTNKMIAIGFGTSIVRDELIYDQSGLDVDVYLSGLYLGLTNHGGFKDGDKSDPKSENPSFSHFNQFSFRLGYSFLMSHNENLSMFVTPYLARVKTTEIWDEEETMGGEYVASDDINISFGSKLGIRSGRFIFSGHFSSYDYGVGIGVAF